MLCSYSYSSKNLIMEGIDANRISVPGNTIVDALQYISANSPLTKTDKTILDEISQLSNNKNGYFLVTLHRNEIKNTHLNMLTKVIIDLAKKKNYAIIWPIHPNKVITNIVLSQTKKHNHVFTLPPVNYNLFLRIMKNASLILTDSGGIQEEATILAKKILVLRNETERQEILQNSNALIGGIEGQNIEANIDLLLNLPEEILVNTSIFGNGDASVKIVSHWRELLH
ncbi:MAG: UDP-N-acetylglucosamine 2-epimerase [Saprospiraceae bacterium]|nr:UDP-N-acetylglucosamine 2-epimerase [Saprospiraceae bacterium]